MEIGKPVRVVVVEPVQDPVRRERTDPEPKRAPEKPERVPAKT